MNHTEVSKFLSYVLRHKPEAIGLTLDTEGWANIDALIQGAASDGKSLDYELIESIVDVKDSEGSKIAMLLDIRKIDENLTKRI